MGKAINMRKIISIDIETSGLDSEKCVILSVGAVVVNLDTKEKEDTFYCELKYESFYGDVYAFNANKQLIESINNTNISNQIPPISKHVCIKGLTPDLFKDVFENWVEKIEGVDVEKIKVTGKNFAIFDKPFLDKILKGSKVKFHRRIIDIGVMFFNPKIHKDIPSLSECLSMVSLNSTVTHNAYEDADQVADLILFKCKN